MKFLLMKNYIYIKNLLIIYLNETIHIIGQISNQKNFLVIEIMI